MMPGPMQAATLQARLAPSAEQAVVRAERHLASLNLSEPAPPWMRLPSDDGAVSMAVRAARTTAPLQDAFQAGAEHLFTRLFCS
eukprot:1195869-Prorocentrum_minimum.AAC.5